MPNYCLDHFPFEDLFDLIEKAKEIDGGIFLGKLVDFDKRFVTDYPTFLYEIADIMKDLELISHYDITKDFGNRKRFDKIKFEIKS